MAVYKVIQDIEAEDHILGPLSLKQFIFAIIAVTNFYFCYLVVSKHAAILCTIFLPPALIAAFFAFPFGKDQPTEVWALAKVRFMFMQRKRIWDQTGMKHLVTITVPKKVDEHRTDGLNQNEVRSRLNALATTIDSRGWALKNVSVSDYTRPGMLPTGSSSDRLIDVNNLPQEVPAYDTQATDDIMDPQNNPVAQQFDQMISASSQAHHQQMMSMMNQATGQAPAANPQFSAPSAAQPADYWFYNQPVGQTNGQVTSAAPKAMNGPQAPMVQAADPTAEEIAFGKRLKAENGKPNIAAARMKTIQPLGQQRGRGGANAVSAEPPAEPEPAPPSAAIMELANNNDLDIATIARQAKKADQEEDEVVISLH